MALRVVVGRERELGDVEELLSRAQRGLAALVVEGEAGIGKTALWTGAVRSASGLGMEVLSCRPAAAEATLAFAALSDLLAHVTDEVLEALPAPQRTALEVALLRTDPVHGRPEPRAVAAGVLGTLMLLAERSPVLVAIDDAQWLDQASAAALAFALRRVGEHCAVGVLAAVRTPTDHDHDLLGLRRHHPMSASIIRLGPLTTPLLQRVLLGEVGMILPRPVLQRVAEASRGNPLLAIELARALARGGDVLDANDPLPVPDDLAALLADRIGCLPATARRALLVASLVSHPTRSLIDRHLGCATADAITQAVRAGLIRVDGEQIRFVHPLHTSAVAATASPQERRALHRRLAELVEDPEEQARHLSLGTTTPDEAVALAVERGAGLARSRGAWGAAADLLERAAELTPPFRPAERWRRLVAAAAHHVHAGDRARGRVLLEGVLSSPSQPQPVLHAEALRLLGTISHADEDAQEAARLLTDALDRTDGPAAASAIHLDLVYVRCTLMDFAGAHEHAHKALEAAGRSGDPTLIAMATAHRAMTTFLCAGGVDWSAVELAVAAHDDDDGLVPLVQRPATLAACLHLYVGRHDEARTRLAELCAKASGSGDESDLAFLLLWRSWLETRAGDLRTAAVLAEESAAVARMTGSPSTHAWALTQQALVHAHLGDVDEARRCCAEAGEPVRRSGSLLPTLWIAAALALVELSLGDAEAAWRACADPTEVVEQHGLGEPVLAFFLPDAVEALITLGHYDRADRLLTQLEQRGRSLDRVWARATAARCRGLLLAATGQPAAALASFEQALAEHRRIGLPFERARTLLAQGVVERRIGQRRKAMSSLSAAVKGFDDMGAHRWGARAEDERSRIPIRRTTAAGALTPTQRQIADLIADGHTNRQIAQRLFVSEKTVEANLTRSYRRLGVRSRAELVARLLDDAPAQRHRQ